MALNLKSDCKKALITTLTNTLKQAQVDNGIFWNYESLGGLVQLDARLPGGDIRKNEEEAGSGLEI